MGNSSSSTTLVNNSSSSKRSSKPPKSSHHRSTTAAATSTNTTDPQDMASRAQKVVGDWHAGFQSGIQQLEENDHPAAQLIDSMCGPYLDIRTSVRDNTVATKRRSSNHKKGDKRYYNMDESDDVSEEEDPSEDDSQTEYSGTQVTLSEDETSYHRRRGHGSQHNKKTRDDADTYESASFFESDVSSNMPSEAMMRGHGADESSLDETTATGGPPLAAAAAAPKHNNNHRSVVTQVEEIGPSHHHHHKQQPLASAFAKRCYFTKAGIGKTTQHYEGLTLTGNVVLMLAQAMKLKGCPTICDEDLRRVEQQYPNQFSRLPDELLLSSGWRRISKYCHFSNKPIPDGVPFFHSKQRLHPTGGYYFLLAAAVGMVRPIDVEPLNRDTLVLLETDYPTACDAAPPILIQDPDQWTLVNKFCFFSGGPINTDEDVYYQADLDTNPIFMLAFLSPSLTPAELYKLDVAPEHRLPTVALVRQVESVYDLTERDFDDLKLYHLGPCRALPPYILQPRAWTKVLPPHFLEAREQALMRAQDFDPTVEQLLPYDVDQMQQMPYDMEHLQQMPYDTEQMQQMPYDTEQMQQMPYDMEQMQQMPYDMEQMQQMPYDMEQMQHMHPMVAAEEPNYYNHAFSMQYGNVPLPTPQGLRVPVGSYNSMSSNLSPPKSSPNQNSFNSVMAGSSMIMTNTVMTQPQLPVSPPVPPQPKHPNVMTTTSEPALPAEPQLPRQTIRIIVAPPPPPIEPRQQVSVRMPLSPGSDSSPSIMAPFPLAGSPQQRHFSPRQDPPVTGYPRSEMRRRVEEEGEFADDSLPMDEAVDSPSHRDSPSIGVDPPEVGEPPSLSRSEDLDEPVPSDEPSVLSAERNADNVANFAVSEPSNYYGAKHPPDEEQYHEKENPVPSPASENDYSSFRGSHTTGPDLQIFPDASMEDSEFAYSKSPNTFPPRSPNSEVSQSSAMRGAQEMLRRSRQRRILDAARKKSPREVPPVEQFEEEEDTSVVSPRSGDAFSPRSGSTFSPRNGDSESTGTWESGSELNSEVSGGSVWADQMTNPDRSSRRALILQMAKTRMRKSGGSVSSSSRMSEKELKQALKANHMEEEKKVDSMREGSSPDIDLTGELD